jgi:hypothetical protein
MRERGKKLPLIRCTLLLERPRTPEQHDEERSGSSDHGSEESAAAGADDTEVDGGIDLEDAETLEVLLPG